MFIPKISSDRSALNSVRLLLNQGGIIRSPLNHIGITVTDLNLAIQWYKDVLGFELLMGSLESDMSNPTIGTICRYIFGEK